MMDFRRGMQAGTHWGHGLAVKLFVSPGQAFTPVPRETGLKIALTGEQQSK